MALALITVGCKIRCTAGEPKISLRFFSDTNGVELFPVFDDVRGIGHESALNFNGNYTLPISIRHDSSYFVFSREGQKDTLGFRYGRDLDAQDGAYCIELTNETLDYSSFYIKDNGFEPCSFLFTNCPDLAYEVHIYL